MGSNLWGDVLDMSEQEDDAVPDVSEQEDDAVPDVSRQVDADEGLTAIEHVDPEALDALVARASAVAADDGPAAEGERLPEPTTHRVDADKGLMGSADITGREPVVRTATLAAPMSWGHLEGVPADGDGGDEQVAYHRRLGASAYMVCSLVAMLGVVVRLAAKMSAKHQPTDHKPEIPLDIMTTYPLTTSLLGLTKHVVQPKIEGIACNV